MDLSEDVCAHLVRHARMRRRINCSYDPDALGSAAGFTLLELLVVVAIIGLLAAYVGPKYFSQIGKSEQSLARAQVEAFAKALDAYRLDVGSYPSTEEGLRALTERPGNNPKWNGAYLQKSAPLDPWGRPYIYRAPGGKGEFDLGTLGRDGQPGGSGDSTDILFN